MISLSIIKNFLGNIFSFITENPAIAIAIVATVGAGFFYIKSEQHKQDKMKAELTLENTQATLDTTSKLVNVLGDSLDVWERRAVQLGDSVDDLDEELDQTTRAKADLEFILDSMRVDSVTPDSSTAQDDTTEVVHYREEQDPFFVEADFTVSPKPVFTSADFLVGLSNPLSFQARVACRDSDVSDDIQSAYVQVIPINGLDSADVSVGDTRISPDVCNPQIEYDSSGGTGEFIAYGLSGAMGGLATSQIVGTSDDALTGTLVGTGGGVLLYVIKESVF